MAQIFFLIRLLFFCVFLTGTGVYILSFYDENRYKAIKMLVYPYWHTGVSRVLNPEQTLMLEAQLFSLGNRINEAIINTCKMMLILWKTFYTYITTDETIPNYTKMAKTTIQDWWEKIIDLIGSNNQKQKS